MLFRFKLTFVKRFGFLKFYWCSQPFFPMVLSAFLFIGALSPSLLVLSALSLLLVLSALLDVF